MVPVEIVYYILLVLHILAWVAALFVYVKNVTAPRVAPGMAHSIATAMVTGVLLAALWVMGDFHDGDPNYLKIGIKLGVALVATVLAFARQAKPAPDPMAHVVAALVAANVLIALVW